MPFFIHKRYWENDIFWYEKLRQTSLGGGNAKKIWNAVGSPINSGWHVTRDKIIEVLMGEEYDSSSYIFLIDLKPNPDHEIVILELLDVWGYTYGNSENSVVYWSPIMLKMQSIYYAEPPHSKEKKNKILKCFTENREEKEIFEFLYLQGDSGNWNWGQTGNVNAALLHPPALDYFKQFICAQS